MINTIIQLLGKPIQNEEVKCFLDANGYKYPKKDTISNRSVDISFWVENKKTRIDLLFGIQSFNPKYKPLQTEKKGIFKPMLTEVRIYKGDTLTFPLGIRWSNSLEELKKLLGEPEATNSLGWTVNSPGWDKGDEISSYKWKKTLNAAEDKYLSIEYDIEQSRITEIDMGIESIRPIMHIANELKGETLQSILASPVGFYLKSDLMFLYWAVVNDKLVLTQTVQADAAQVKSGQLSIMDFMAKHFAKGYLHYTDFNAAEYNFLYTYYNNMGPYYISYRNDIMYAHFTDNAHRNNPMGDDALTFLDTHITLSKGDFEKAEKIISERLKEYNAHQFAKSKKVYK